MKRAFGDSFFFIALLSARDSNHETALRFSHEWEGHITTTRWILAEIGNALSGITARGSFTAFLEGLLHQDQITVLPDSDGLFEAGAKLFATRPDKEWSLTDCISFEAMRLLGLTEAITADRHFEQAGFTLLLVRKS